jgi:DNA-binding CsgD family transcriptional regulator
MNTCHSHLSKPLAKPFGPHTYTQLHSLQQGFVGEVTPSADLIASALDVLACGVIIVDTSGRVLHRNLAADEVLMRNDSVAIERGIIVASYAPDAHLLRDAMVKGTMGKRSMIALGPLSQTTVAVVPLVQTRHTGETSSNSGSKTDMPLGDKPQFALVFSRAGMADALLLSFFARAHNLTATEERVLALMCACLTAPEMAEQLNVGCATIRTHVRSICTKTHCHGIREVVERVAVLPPLMTSIAMAALNPAHVRATMPIHGIGNTPQRQTVN